MGLGGLGGCGGGVGAGGVGVVGGFPVQRAAELPLQNMLPVDFMKHLIKI